MDGAEAQDPDASNEDALELLNRQFGCLGDALRDAAPGVRAPAVAGMCRLLNAYWEIIPSPVIAGFLQRIGGAPPALPPTCDLADTGALVTAAGMHSWRLKSVRQAAQHECPVQSALPWGPTMP